MILDPAPAHDSHATLDDLFRRAVSRSTNALALADPPNVAGVTGGKPLRLTFAEADRAISAIAVKLRTLGLQTDAVVAFQLPNTAASVLTLLGILRAGMIAMPLPLLWRNHDITTTLAGTAVKALITCTRVGPTRHAQLMMHAAAGLFSVRHVAAWGTDLPDGVTALDDITTDDAPAALQSVPRNENPATHVAVVTWHDAPAGAIAMPRSHRQLIAGGLAVLLEASIQPASPIISTVPATSFAGIASAVLPWLLSGGTLALHHPFDAATFTAQQKSFPDATIVVPGPLAERLTGRPKALAVWRAPERIVVPPAQVSTSRVDILAFGEIGLLASRATADGAVAAIPFGPIAAPRGAATATSVIETTRSTAGTLMFRGAMVPSAPFPPRTARLDVGDGFVDTCQPCRIANVGDEGATLRMTGPQPGMTGIGGYRFSQSQLNSVTSRFGGDVTIVALPDALMGQRLAGRAKDQTAVLQTLVEAGHNPLFAHAFRQRTPAIG